MKIKQEYFIDVFIWTIFFYFTSLYCTGNSQVLIFMCFSIILLTFLIKFREDNKKVIIKDKNCFILWNVFSISILITSILNFNNIVFSFILVFFIPFIFFKKIIIYKNIDKIIVLSILISDLLILLNCFGIFNFTNSIVILKSNSMALYLITMLSTLLYFYYKYNNYIFIFIILNLILIFFTDSRTVLISSIIIIIITMYFKSIKNIYSFIISLVIYCIIICLLVLLFEYFKEQIFNIDILKKFIEYKQKNDIFNGRSEIWKYIFGNINLTGHSIKSIYNIFGLSPHSNYFGILYYNGLIAFISFIFLNIKILFSYLKEKDNFFFLITILIFLMTSITEYYFGVFSLPITYIWFIAIGKKIYCKEGE